MKWIQHTIGRCALMQLADVPVARREEGQTLVEYALILVLIAVVVVAVLGTVGGTIRSMWGNISSSV